MRKRKGLIRPAQLNSRQQSFAQEYLIDGNATKSAVRAGYSAKTASSQGQRLLRNVEIAAAIAKAQAMVQERTEITVDKVVQALWLEACRMGEGSSHGARVAALGVLAKHLGMFPADKVELGITERSELYVALLRTVKKLPYPPPPGPALGH